jgi:N-acetylmuramoyl-L-alanine amidase
MGFNQRFLKGLRRGLRGLNSLFVMTKRALMIQVARLLPLLAAVLLPGCALFDDGATLSTFRTVVVDAGHGGYDRGAKAVRGLDEKMLTLDVARRLKPLLEQRGYRVIMTRTSDVFIPLGGRTAISNIHPDAAFVSIHFNSSPRRAANGVETYYYNPRSAPLAANILREIATCYGSHSRGVKFARYYVLHHNERPATLLELGFISNAKENASLQDPRLRQRLAERIAAGIARGHGGRAPAVGG